VRCECDRICGYRGLLADADRQRAGVFDLARGVRAVAALVLQPLNEEAVEAAVRQRARQEEQVTPPATAAEEAVICGTERTTCGR
jgi:hypothetical protein